LALANGLKYVRIEALAKTFLLFWLKPIWNSTFARQLKQAAI